MNTTTRSSRLAMVDDLLHIAVFVDASANWNAGCGLVGVDMNHLTFYEQA